MPSGCRDTWGPHLPPQVLWAMLSVSLLTVLFAIGIVLLVRRLRLKSE